MLSVAEGASSQPDERLLIIQSAPPDAGEAIQVVKVPRQMQTGWNEYLMTHLHMPME